MRLDTYDRPELHLGSYEFIATKDYCKVIAIVDGSNFSSGTMILFIAPGKRKKRFEKMCEKNLEFCGQKDGWVYFVFVLLKDCSSIYFAINRIKSCLARLPIYL